MGQTFFIHELNFYRKERKGYAQFAKGLFLVQKVEMLKCQIMKCK